MFELHLEHQTGKLISSPVFNSSRDIWNSQAREMVACTELPWHFYLGDMSAYNFQHILDGNETNDDYYLLDEPSISIHEVVHVSEYFKICI